MFATVGFD